MNKYVAEAFGTAVLVLVGCGAVVAANTLGAGLTPPVDMGASVHTQGLVAIALAFGLAVTAMAYGIGPVSGCHINPAVTVALWSAGRLETKELGPYIGAQVAGAFIGVVVLAMIVGGVKPVFGQTTWNPATTSFVSAFIAEFVATMIFTVVILGVTQAKGGGGNVAGLVIGLTLALLHLAFVPVTGNSLNPARTLAPNLFVGGQAALQIWLYILAPLAGAYVAGQLFKTGMFAADEKA
jgi:aquaporin Z